MELTLILLTVLMFKDPTIFLQCSFSPVYVVLILIFQITWGCLLDDIAPVILVDVGQFTNCCLLNSLQTL